MPNIHQELLIAAPPEKIYAAITTEEGLSAWWTPEATAKPDLNSIARFPFGTDYFKEMKITELKPSEFVKWNCIKGAEEWVGTNLSFKIDSGDKKLLLNAHPEVLGQVQQQKNFEKGSLLIFHHDDWKEYSPTFAECSYTWGQFLRSLKLYCETGEGRPWPDQHLVK